MQEPRLAAKAVLINPAGKVLILTRSDTDIIRPGELDLPGGRVEEGENYEVAAQREIEEEVGLDISLDDLHLVFTDTTHYEGKTTIRFLYAAALDDAPDITLSQEHSDYAWMSLSEAAQNFSHPVWVEGIKFAFEHDLLPATIAA